MGDKDGKIRLRLAEDIINDQVGGAGWMYLDIALQMDKYSPKTVLVKTKWSDQQGKIVLEPKAQEKTSNYLGPKDPNAAQTLHDVSVKTYKKEVSWKQTYSYERSVSGNVSLKAVEAVGFSAEGSKTNKRRVKTTCTDLEHRSVDIEDLRSALSALTAQTSAEGIRNETSFLVVTDVLVAGEVSIVETRDSKKDGKVSVAAQVHEVGVGAGGGTSKETAASLERRNTNIILAIKLARVHYDEEGTINRDGVLAGGSYDGNYTVGVGDDDRERHYAVKILAKRLGVNKNTFEIQVDLIGRQNHAEVNVPQDICQNGLYQTRKSHPAGPELLPLKGILVSMSRKRKNFLARLMPRVTSNSNDIMMSKVLVTDLEQDKTYVCPCIQETAITDGYNFQWFDCKEWREAFAAQEFPVTIDGKSCNVYEEDPIFRVFGDQPFSDVGRGEPYDMDELQLKFEACQVTLRVGEDERIDTLPEKVLSLLAVFKGGQMVTDLDQLVCDMDAMSMAIKENAAQGDHNTLNVMHDGKVITDLAQTYRQLGIHATAHVQLQSWDPENPPVVPTIEELEKVNRMIDRLIQELERVEQGEDDEDDKDNEKQPEERDWDIVRSILWRHLELQEGDEDANFLLYRNNDFDRSALQSSYQELEDGDPDIPPEALKMLIRAVGENSVAGEVLQTILEAASERQGEGGTEGASGGSESAP
ncbi:Hypp8896 [Branchiostoma lanceolatum]|uniref:Hypp8896 protein n=1 Tax=Branchiostoma lanceolatum TaxID=7740 RepID=A0A8K0EJ31_BRALA|nr:Hypp8896 [Branchiostoma lanceolatum]